MSSYAGRNIMNRRFRPSKVTQGARSPDFRELSVSASGPGSREGEEAHRVDPVAGWTFSRAVALAGYEPPSVPYVAGRADVSAWLPIAVVVGARIILRLIAVLAAIRQEQSHARSNREQMDTAARSKVVLCERRADGTTLLIIPKASELELIPEDEAVRCRIHEMSPS